MTLGPPLIGLAWTAGLFSLLQYSNHKKSIIYIEMSVFGALNRFIARLDADGDAPKASNTRGVYGFQVLRNKNTELQVEPWFDFIVGINGRTIVRPVNYNLNRLSAYLL